MRSYNAISALLDYEDTSLSFVREVSCFATIDHNIISSTTNNSSGSVEFDFFTIWETIKKSSERGKVAYMIHSHPPAFNRMSGIDENMVYGWCMAINIPIWFIVITEDEIVLYNCWLDNQEKIVKTQLVDVLKYYEVCAELKVIASVIYGMSKAKEISQKEVDNTIGMINQSNIEWNDIHTWNVG